MHPLRMRIAAFLFFSSAQNLRLKNAVTNNIADKQLKNSCDLYETGKNEEIDVFSIDLM